jgi:hypothetical protein
MTTKKPLTTHPGMTIRIYRVNAETGGRENLTTTIVVPSNTDLPLAPLDFGACMCPRCVPGRRK